MYRGLDVRSVKTDSGSSENSHRARGHRTMRLGLGVYGAQDRGL